MIIASTTILNEIDYLPLIFEKVLQYKEIGKFICVEGCVESCKEYYLKRKRVTAGGLSVDGTTEVIDEWVKKDNRVVHIKAGFICRVECGMFYYLLEQAKEGDYLWLFNGTEVYPDSLIRECISVMDTNEYDVIGCHHIVLWHDFYHRITSDKSGIWWEYGGRPRAYKVYNGMYYPHGDANSFIPRPPRHEVWSKKYLASEPFFHLGYARSVERVVEKIAWQEIDYNFWVKSTYASRYRSIEDYISRTNAWFTCEYDERYNVSVVRNHYQLPEYLLSHPFAKYYWDEQQTFWRELCLK